MRPDSNRPAATRSTRQHLAVRDAVADQAGVVNRRQLLAAGWTDSRIQSQLAAGRWVPDRAGVYRTDNGVPTIDARLHSALLGAPKGGVLSHRSAAFVHGFCGTAPEVIEIRAAFARHHSAPEGVLIHRSRRDPNGVLVRGFAVTCVEDTVLDLVATSRSDREAVGWILAACQHRMTTPTRILHALAVRRCPRRGALVREMCREVTAGVDTPLELRYVRDVERSHGLPTGRRRVRERTPRSSVYRDVEYEEFGVLVELDGRIGHEAESDRHRDRRRDNKAAITGRATLRFGWTDTVNDTCEVARDVVRLLQSHGWRGRPHPCPRCRP